MWSRPTAADGVGNSLQRVNPVLYGNDPANWTAANPTPGAEFIGGQVPSILVQPRSQVVYGGQDTSFSVVATGTPPPTMAMAGIMPFAGSPFP